ncbi:MAG: hypothetical protein HY323_15570 [Betaproteobacteria bacterium]|nr:hypothetical protein [Betaproteobacteria bacterium]
MLIDATTFPYREAIFAGEGRRFIFVDSGATDLVSTAELPSSGVVKILLRHFIVGFKPQGAETALFRSPTDLVLPSSSKALETARKRFQKEKNRGAVALLESWLNADEKVALEQKETFEYLVKVLDEDRPSNRKLFP